MAHHDDAMVIVGEMQAHLDALIDSHVLEEHEAELLRDDLSRLQRLEQARDRDTIRVDVVSNREPGKSLAFFLLTSEPKSFRVCEQMEHRKLKLEIEPRSMMKGGDEYPIYRTILLPESVEHVSELMFKYRVPKIEKSRPRNKLVRLSR